jgi:hypothetical protein
MQANEFVKKFGWDKAKELLAKANGCASIKSMGHHFLYSDLERLVESYELVQSHGGLSAAKDWLKADGLSALNKDFNGVIQAISNVESCQ